MLSASVRVANTLAQVLIGLNGPWERQSTLEWWNDKVTLLEFAQLFARHIDDERKARRLTSHVADDRPWTSHVARVLHTFLCTHEQTELDMKLGVCPARSS